MPRLVRSVILENRWLKETLRQHHFDGIISDNRYGLYHSMIPSVILTHQPGLKTGLGSVVDKVIRKIHFSFLARFKETWIVDEAGALNLAGELSHPAKLPDNAQYCGLLSQMMAPNTNQQDTTGHLLILLSGPEPQRTILERILWEQIQSPQGKIIFVAGKTGDQQPNHIPAHIEYYTKLHSSLLQPIIEHASYIICRSGYSTLMDLVLLKKKAILIPTPGQTEQEYLGIHLMKQGIFPSYQQPDFCLCTALAAAADFPFNGTENFPVNHRIAPLLNRWLQSI